jgi:hypothetical protein
MDFFSFIVGIAVKGKSSRLIVDDVIFERQFEFELSSELFV